MLCRLLRTTGLIDRGVYVSRNVLRFIFFPGSVIRQALFADCIFFRRGKSSSKAPLYKDVAAHIAAGRNVIVYAEGTRNPHRKKLPLRMGLVKLAYDQQFPLFVSMTSNKQDIFDEHRFVVSFGVTIVNKKSPIIHPASYPDLPAFIDAVQRAWDALWFDLIDPPSSKNPHPSRSPGTAATTTNGPA